MAVGSLWCSGLHLKERGELMVEQLQHSHCQGGKCHGEESPSILMVSLKLLCKFVNFVLQNS